MLVNIIDKRADLRLGELRIRANALTFDPHLIVDKRGEQIHGDTVQGIVVLDKLGKVMTVHLRHLDIADKTGYVIENITAEVLMTAYVIPRVLAVVERNDIGIARLAECALDKGVQERRILRYNDMLARLGRV